MLIRYLKVFCNNFFTEKSFRQVWDNRHFMFRMSMLNNRKYSILFLVESQILALTEMC